MPVTFDSYFLLAAGFILLVSLEAVTAAKNSRSLHDILAGKGSASLLNLKQLAGIACCSAVILYNYSLYGQESTMLEPRWNSSWSFHSLAFAAISFSIGYLAAKDTNWNRMERRPGVSNHSFISLYFLLRVIYLIVYEGFFRGVMLFLFIHIAGTAIGIVLSTILYTMAHAYSNRNEIIGTLPFGFLLCAMTLVHQSVWPAIIIHLLLALGNEARSVKHKYSLIKSSHL